MVRAATIRDAEDVDRLHGEVWDRFGRVDHLVNNAGGQFSAVGDRLFGEGLERRHRHQSERPLVHDAGRRPPLA